MDPNPTRQHEFYPLTRRIVLSTGGNFPFFGSQFPPVFQLEGNTGPMPSLSQNAQILSRLWRRISHISQILRWQTKGILGIPRQLIVETCWRLGDEIMALPIYSALHKAYPNDHITALCNYPDILRDHPAIDRIAIPSERATIEQMADRYLLLRGADRTQYRIACYAQMAGIPIPSERPRLQYQDWTTNLLTTVPKPFLAIATGASWPIKRWPMENWQELCHHLIKTGYGLVELGQAGEAIEVGVDLTGRTSVGEAARILHAAQLLICCDSGLMHVALAAGTPVLALFGPTDPAILVRDEPAFHVVQSQEGCSGCWNRRGETVRPGECPRNRAYCMERISVNDVLTHLGKMEITHD